jgi:hypothetical protein
MTFAGKLRIIRVAEQDAQGLKMAGYARADLNGDGDGRHAAVPAQSTALDRQRSLTLYEIGPQFPLVLL